MKNDQMKIKLDCIEVLQSNYKFNSYVYNLHVSLKKLVNLVTSNSLTMMHESFSSFSI